MKNKAYEFKPALRMFVLVNVRREATRLRWAVDPYVTLHLARFGTFGMVQTGLAAIRCTILVMGQPPPNSGTIIVCVKLGMALLGHWSSRQNFFL